MDFIKDLTIDSLRNAAEDVFNQAKPKTDHEARVYEVLSHKNWGSSSTVMNEIARDTFDYDKFPIITRIMWDSMENQRPAAWRVVFKGLTLLEHLIKNGSEKCVDDARTHAAILRKLFQFNYYEGTVDRGLGVREKSKQLIELLGDDERIREERSKAKQLRERFGGKLGGVGNISSGGGGSQYGGYGNDLNWENRPSSGYGESGIGASGGRNSSAAGDRSYGNDSGGGFSGRYSDDSATKASQSSSISNTPTFATIPDEKAKVVKKKKKKKPVEAEKAEAPTVPEVDLFSFDLPTAPTQISAVEFDAFGNSPAPVSHSKAPFDAFSSAPAQSVAQNNSTFDAFGPTVSGKDHQQAQSFDDFGEFTAAPVAVMGSPQGLAPVTTMGPPQMMTGQQNLHFSAFGNRPPNSSAVVNQMSNAFGQMNVGIGNVAMTVPKESVAAASSAPFTVDDEFGDFSSANQMKSSGANNDPLSRLIQLDGLSKNQPKNSNSAVVGAVGNQHVGFVHNTNPYANASSGFVNTMSANSSLPQAGGAAVIGMMSPQVMMTPKQTTMGMTMNTTPGIQNMQMGTMPFQQQMMMTQHQNGMAHPYVNAGMTVGMAQSGGMMNSQMMQQQQVHQGGMNPQMMQGAMGMSGDMSMAGGMMGGTMPGGMMGGQSMQGWR